MNNKQPFTATNNKRPFVDIKQPEEFTPEEARRFIEAILNFKGEDENE